MTARFDQNFLPLDLSIFLYDNNGRAFLTQGNIRHLS